MRNMFSDVVDDVLNGEARDETLRGTQLARQLDPGLWAKVRLQWADIAVSNSRR